jgi:RNA polymerase sigma-70 factor (ECF subfamily)
MNETRVRSQEDAAFVRAAMSGCEDAFTALVEPYRRELQAHCFRMTRSLADAEDLVQETMFRAWRSRETFEGRSTVRAWLYRIATNACLDTSAWRRPDALLHSRSCEEGVDELIDRIASTDEAPDAAVVRRETIELAFLAVIQVLPPRQRAVLILRDVWGWSATDTAQLLDMTLFSVQSAAQRARETMKGRLARQRVDWALPTRPDAAQLDLLRRYLIAHERGDAQAVAALVGYQSVRAAPADDELTVAS